MNAKSNSHVHPAMQPFLRMCGSLPAVQAAPIEEEPADFRDDDFDGDHANEDQKATISVKPAIVFGRSPLGINIYLRESDGDEQPIRHVVRHSPDGFNWGYGGSGPADAALSILTEIYGSDVAEKHYQSFKNKFVASVPVLGGEIPVEEIDRWLDARLEPPVAEVGS